MAIRVQASNISGQNQLQPESFGIRRDTRNLALESVANTLGQVAQVGSDVYQSNIQKQKRLEAAAEEAARLRKQAETAIANRQKTADQLQIDTRYHNNKNNLLVLEAEVMRSIKNGTFNDPVVDEDGVEGPSLREQWQSIRSAEFKTDDLHDPTLAVKQRNNLDTDWIEASVRISNQTDQRIILNQVSSDEVRASQNVDQIINLYPTTAIPEDQFNTTLQSIEAFAESTYSRQLNQNSLRTVNSQGSDLAVKLFKHKIDTALDDKEIDAVVKEFDTYNAQHNYIAAGNEEVAKYAKEKKKEGFDIKFGIAQERELRNLNTALEFGKNLMSLSPTDPVNIQEVQKNLKLLETVQFFNELGSLKNGDKTILNDTQAQNLLEMQEFMKTFLPNKDATEFSEIYSPIVMEAIDEVKKLKDPNYRVSRVLPEGLALYGETATKYTNYRNALATYIHTGLQDKDARVLKALVPHLENNPRQQREEMKRLFVDEFGYDERDFFTPSNIEVNFAQIDSVVQHLSDVRMLNISNPDTILKRGYDLINQKDPTTEERMLGQLYMAVAMAPEMDESKLVAFANNYISIFDAASQSGIVPDGYYTRADNLDVLPELEVLARYYRAQDRNDLHTYYSTMRRGLIAKSWFDLSDTELKELYQKKLDKKDKDEDAHNFKFPKIDRYIRQSIANTANHQLFSVMGATKKSKDFDTYVYIPPNIFNETVQTEIDTLSPFLRDYVVGTPLYQFFENHYGNSFLMSGYKDTSEAVADRIMEVNWTVISEHEDYNLRDAFTPTVLKVAEAVAADAAFDTDLKKEVKSFFNKLDKYLDDPDKLYDWVASAKIPTSTSKVDGSEKPAFRFDKISTHGGKVGTAPHIFNPSTGKYEAFYYVKNGRSIQLIITEDEQRSVIREEGFTIPRTDSAVFDDSPLMLSEAGLRTKAEERIAEGRDF